MKAFKKKLRGVDDDHTVHAKVCRQCGNQKDEISSEICTRCAHPYPKKIKDPNDAFNLNLGTYVPDIRICINCNNKISDTQANYCPNCACMLNVVVGGIPGYIIR
ncbi:MAG: hypothetical protein OEV93_01660 [Candidatus Moranbacteria bacterium]|nr:hypothetical protein [Candidatus Moranbacteria bacterium]